MLPDIQFTAFSQKGPSGPGSSVTSKALSLNLGKSGGGPILSYKFVNLIIHGVRLFDIQLCFLCKLYLRTRSKTLLKKESSWDSNSLNEKEMKLKIQFLIVMASLLSNNSSM